MRSQLDRLAVEDLETIEAFLSFDATGHLYLRTSSHDHPYQVSMQHRLMEVRADDGRILYRNERLGNRELGSNVFSGEGVGTYSPRSYRLSDSTPVRIVSRRHFLEGHPILIRIGFSEEELWLNFWYLVLGLVAGVPLALTAAGIGGYFLARCALSPIERMGRRAREIHSERMGARLDVENPEDELGQLAEAFNETLSGLEQLVGASVVLYS